MSWINWVIDGARVWSDVRQAEDKAKISQDNEDAQIAANRSQGLLADNNAKLSDWQAADALYRGGIEVKNANTRTRMLKGRQIVAAADSGVEIGSGSVVNLLTDTDMLGAEEASTLKYNADREAWAYRMQSLDSRNRAEILRHSKVPVADSAGAGVTAALINNAARMYERNARDG